MAWDLDGSLQTPELNPLPVLRESMTNRGWQGRDSRSYQLLQLERAGLDIRVPPEEIEAVLKRDS